jgi:imidazole glycerol-phosphate synthase subunit HisF
MSDPRVIPVLLLGKSGLVKTEKFQNPRYIGDPINTVRIFNEKAADELVLLDIYATQEGRGPDVKRVRTIASECRMPLTYGGGVSDLDTATRLIESGVEKVALSSAAIANPDLVSQIARVIGSQSVAAVLDYKRGWTGGRTVYTVNGTRKVDGNLVDLAHRLIDAGAGEIVFNSISDDGMMHGFDIKLTKEVADEIDTPMTFVGGCGTPEHLKELFTTCRFVGAGVGSMFIYKSALKGVLINYLQPSVKAEVIDAGKR